MSQHLQSPSRRPSFRTLRRRRAALGAMLASLACALAAPAQQEPSADHELAGALDEQSEVSFAAGVSLGFLRMQELGAVYRFRFVPALVAHAYVPLAPRWFLRPGVRLGYAGLEQAQSSYGAGIEEHSVQGTAELGLQYDAWLVPALSVGAGAQRREIAFVGRGIVAGSDVLDRTEWLGLLYAQAGLGVPLWDGLIVIEPYARVQHTFSDARSLLQLGADITIGF